MLLLPSGRETGGGSCYQAGDLGFCQCDTKTGYIESGGADRTAVWLLDTDYDGCSLYPRQVICWLAGRR